MHARSSFNRVTRCWTAVALTLLIAATLMFPRTSAPSAIAATPGPGDTDPKLYSPVLASQRKAIYAETKGNLTSYQIDATFTPFDGQSLATIEGAVVLQYVNITNAAQKEIYFRMYPNAAEYADGGMTIDRVTSDGDALNVDLSVEDTLATVTLPRSLPAGEAISLTLAFTTTIPTDPVDSYGMFSYDANTGSYALAHWLPLLAGYDPIQGWELGPPSALGDPVFTNAALFDVRITAPADFTFVTTGSVVDSTPAGDDVTRHFVSGPVRDFVMAADADFQVESIKVGGTTVNSYSNPDSLDGGLAVLTAGAQSLEIYSRLFGEYPYAELDLVQIDLGNGAGGVEFPQLLFIGSDYYGQNEASQSIPGFLEFVVAHEVGHQWWYALVGNDQYRHAFLDEGLTNYLTTVYFAEQYGAQSGEEQVDYNLKASYFSLLFNDGDQIVDQPTDDFPSQRSYGSIIYGKAALGFGAIRAEIGDSAFFAALHTYVEAFRFKVATPDDLKSAFETASGKNLDELWRHWFEAAEGRQDFDAADLAKLLQDIGR